MEIAPERWLEFHMSWPTTLAMHPLCKQVVVQAGCVTDLYDLPSGEKHNTWNRRFGTIQFSPDGRSLLTVDGDEVVVWDAQTCQEIRRITGNGRTWDDPQFRSYGTFAAINAAGDRVAIANRDRSFERDLPDAILIYDARTGELRQTLVIVQVQACDVSGICRRWPTPARPGSGPVYGLWDTESGKRVVEFPAQATAISEPQWPADCQRLHSEPPRLGRSRSGCRLGDRYGLGRVDRRRVEFFLASRSAPRHGFSPDATQLLAAIEIREPQNANVP